MKNIIITPTSPVIATKNFDLVKCFCIVDDFFGIVSLNQGKKGGRPSVLFISELVTICIIGQVYEVSCLKRL
jgi:hypothetical protein